MPGEPLGERQPVAEHSQPQPGAEPRGRSLPRRLAAGVPGRPGPSSVVVGHARVSRETSPSLTPAGRRRGGAARRPRTPTPGPAASTSSWTTLRSKAVIGLQRRALAGALHLRRSPPCASSTSAARRSARWPATSSIRRLRSPVADCTASRVSSCSASSTLPSGPTRRRGHPALLGVDDRHRGAVAVDVDVDVAVEVGDVEQRLEEVRRHLTLALEVGRPGGRVAGARRRAAPSSVAGPSSSAASSGVGAASPVVGVRGARAACGRRRPLVGVCGRPWLGHRGGPSLVGSCVRASPSCGPGVAASAACGDRRRRRCSRSARSAVVTGSVVGLRAWSSGCAGRPCSPAGRLRAGRGASCASCSAWAAGAGRTWLRRASAASAAASSQALDGELLAPACRLLARAAPAAPSRPGEPGAGIRRIT